jgi:hypothetical protein
MSGSQEQGKCLIRYLNDSYGECVTEHNMGCYVRVTMPDFPKVIR